MIAPAPLLVTPFSLAQRFIGTREIPGARDNPQVLAWLRLDEAWPEHDEVANCSAFMNWIFWILSLPRSKSLRARSWLRVGVEIPRNEARPGFDVVVCSRGEGEQPGPTVINAPGHVGLFAGWGPPALGDAWMADRSDANILGANQHDEVSVARFPARSILAVRRVTLSV